MIAHARVMDVFSISLQILPRFFSRFRFFRHHRYPLLCQDVSLIHLGRTDDGFASCFFTELPFSIENSGTSTSAQASLRAISNPQKQLSTGAASPRPTRSLALDASTSFWLNLIRLVFSTSSIASISSRLIHLTSFLKPRTSLVCSKVCYFHHNNFDLHNCLSLSISPSLDSFNQAQL